MTSMERLAKLEERFSTEQARAILQVIEEQAITRDYLDARLNELRNQLAVFMVAVAGLAVGIAKLLG